MKVWCSILEGPLTGNVLTFEEDGTLLIGRNVAQGLMLPNDPLVSRHHAVIEIEWPECWVRDLASRNGTFVNGQRIVEQRLQSGDRVKIGATLIEVTIEPPSPEKGRCTLCGNEAPLFELFVADVEGPTGRGVCRACRELAPRRIPGLTIERVLGEGGMGTVFLARTETGREVAVKTLRPDRPPAPTALAEILREARNGASLEHPNAVRIFDQGYVFGLFYFVMEYVPGPNLQHFLETRAAPLEWHEAAPIADQILSVLEVAHARQLVHRDLKPANILLASPPPQAIVKLADFGLMRSTQKSLHAITKTGTAKGTPAFMPPEQLEDAKRAGPPADVYALAATLFFALTLQEPLETAGSVYPILAVLEGVPRSARALNPHVPHDVDGLLARCLAKSPDERPTASALRRALAGV